MVDTTGLLIKVVVHSAEITDSDGAILVFNKICQIYQRLKLIWADMGYRGMRLKQWIEKFGKWKLEIVKRPQRWGQVSRGCRAATDAGFHSFAPAMGSRKNVWMDRALSADEQRL